MELIFAQVAAFQDPAKLVNAGFNGGRLRAIDIREGEAVNAAAFTALVKEKIAFNLVRKIPTRT
jgi:hypothetical protein